MLIGYDFFGLDEGSVFKTKLTHSNYYELEVKKTMVDEIYVDENIDAPFTVEKPIDWTYSTVMNAKLMGNLEGGNIQNSGLVVEKIRLQKRKWNELEWVDVGELEYRKDENILYELTDKYVANDYIYQYSLIPVTSDVLGNRILSDEITVEFEGVFLSDNDNNYRLLYDLEFGTITHNSPSSMSAPPNAQYPIISYSNLDYTDFDIQATFLSDYSLNEQDKRQFNIRMEKTERENLLKWIKNKKPKIYRDINGNLKLVAIIENPQEIPMNNVNIIAKLNLKMVEIGKFDSETLRAYNLIEELGGVI